MEPITGICKRLSAAGRCTHARECVSFKSRQSPDPCVERKGRPCAFAAGPANTVSGRFQPAFRLPCSPRLQLKLKNLKLKFPCGAVALSYSEPEAFKSARRIDQDADFRLDGPYSALSAAAASLLTTLMVGTRAAGVPAAYFSDVAT